MDASGPLPPLYDKLEADIPWHRGPRPRGKWRPSSPPYPAADKHDHNSSKGSPIEAMSSASERGPQQDASASLLLWSLRCTATSRKYPMIHGSWGTRMIFAEVPNRPWITEG